MRHIGRSALTALLAVGAALIVAFASTIMSIVTLTATGLYMGGTDHPLSIPQDTTEYIQSYVDGAYTNFVGPSGLCTPDCSPATVYTPAQFWPITGLHDMTFDESVALGVANLDRCVRGDVCTATLPPYISTGPEHLTDTSYTVFGYSQSAAVASIEKSDLIAHPPAPATVAFVLVSNPNRPNGGILERFVGVHIPVLGVTFNGATPTNSPQPTPLTTVDVARQYDPVPDFPTNPLNLLANLNALAGFIYLHPEANYFDAGTPLLQGQYRDTTYYLIPTRTLPLLMPLEQIPVIGPPLAVTLDPPLRVLVERSYDRTVNPGAPTPAKFLYFPGPVKTAINLAVAVPTGWDNGIAYIAGDPAHRPFHTAPPGPYGVGGPPVYAGAVDPYGPPTLLTTTTTTTAVTAASTPAATTDPVARSAASRVSAARQKPAVPAASADPADGAAPGRAARSPADASPADVQHGKRPGGLGHSPRHADRTRDAA